MGYFQHTGRSGSYTSPPEAAGFNRRMEVLRNAADNLADLLHVRGPPDEDRIARTLKNINFLFFGEYVSSVDPKPESRHYRPTFGPGHARPMRTRPSKTHPLANHTKLSRFMHLLLNCNKMLSYEEMAEYLNTKKSTVYVLSSEARKLMTAIGFPHAITTVYGVGFQINAQDVDAIRDCLIHIAASPWLKTPETEVSDEPPFASLVSPETPQCTRSHEAPAPHIGEDME
jgi:hypothetical protein